MNPHNHIKSLQQKYKNNATATEALKEGLAISSGYVQDLLSSLQIKAKTTRATKLAALKAYTDVLKSTFQSIISNETVTQSELAEARQIFMSKLIELEAFLVKL